MDCVPKSIPSVPNAVRNPVVFIATEGESSKGKEPEKDRPDNDNNNDAKKKKRQKRLDNPKSLVESENEEVDLTVPDHEKPETKENATTDGTLRERYAHVVDTLNPDGTDMFGLDVKYSNVAKYGEKRAAKEHPDVFNKRGEI